MKIDDILNGVAKVLASLFVGSYGFLFLSCFIKFFIDFLQDKTHSKDEGFLIVLFLIISVFFYFMMKNTYWLFKGKPRFWIIMILWIIGMFFNFLGFILVAFSGWEGAFSSSN